jgi:hypothetical protein
MEKQEDPAPPSIARSGRRISHRLGPGREDLRTRNCRWRQERRTATAAADWFRWFFPDLLFAPVGPIVDRGSTGQQARDAFTFPPRRTKTHRMTPTRATGWTHAPIASNIVDPVVASSLPERRHTIWALDRERMTARLAEPLPALQDWTVPIAPMVGCFGVAPALNQAISTATSGPYGGNMDYPLFAPGTKVQFPVFASGALFYLGDGHASQGDGEIVANGIETSFENEFAIRVLKGRTIAWPRAQTSDQIFTVEMQDPRPGASACDHGDDELAIRRLRSRPGRFLARPRAVRAVRHSKRLQPSVFSIL